MKKWIFALIIFLLTPSAQAGMVIGSGEVGCSSPDSNATGTNIIGLGKSTENQLGHAGSWSAGSSYTLKSFTVDIAKAGNPDLTLTASICTDNAGKPSLTCTAADATLATTSISASRTTYRFTIAAGYAVSASTRYHRKVVLSAKAPDALNYINVYWNNTGTEIQTYTNDDSIWTNLDTSSTSVFSTNTCEAP